MDFGKEFNREAFIDNVINVINRVSNMKDKVKALKILDFFQDKNEKYYYQYIFVDDELCSIYMDVLDKWQDIHRTLNEKEERVYGDSLPE